MFQGQVVVNNITNHLRDKDCYPALPLGRVVIEDGHTVMIILAHVDDFLIVGTT